MVTNRYPRNISANGKIIGHIEPINFTEWKAVFHRKKALTDKVLGVYGSIRKATNVIRLYNTKLPIVKEFDYE